MVTPWVLWKLISGVAHQNSLRGVTPRVLWKIVSRVVHQDSLRGVRVESKPFFL